MDIMEAGPSQPSADPINDLFGRFAGGDDDDDDHENDDPAPGPPLAARVVNPGRVPVSDRPARPASIGNSRGSRKPIASDRRDSGFGDGGFRLLKRKAARATELIKNQITNDDHKRLSDSFTKAVQEAPHVK